MDIKKKRRKKNRDILHTDNIVSRKGKSDDYKSVFSRSFLSKSSSILLTANSPSATVEHPQLLR